MIFIFSIVFWQAVSFNRYYIEGTILSPIGLQMIQPPEILKAIFQTFDMSAITDFKRFLAKNAQVRKWQIAADFCLHDKDRPNNVFAFSIIPYDDYHPALVAEIRQAIPKDLKRTRDIQNKTEAFLIDSRRFHFGFILEDSPGVFNNGSGSKPIQIARESLALSVKVLEEHGRSKENLRRLRDLLHKSKANNFNVSLLSDLYVLSYLYCFVTLALARENDIEVVGWFSDRDSMTTWCDGVLWDICRESLHGLAQHFNVKIPKDAPIVALPTPDGADGDMWFDEYIRLPDYFAGILSAWNFKTNELPGEKDKYKQLAECVVAEADNLVVIKIRYSDTFQASRIVFNSAEKANG